MILVISTRELEASTKDVMEWLDSLGANYMRLNGQDFADALQYSYSFFEGNYEATLQINDKVIDLKDISTIWYRRDGYSNVKNISSIEDENLRYEVAHYARDEEIDTRRAFYHLLAEKACLTTPSTEKEINKLHALNKAQAAGLDIPQTILCNNKSSLTDFYQKVGRCITKAISNGKFYLIEGSNYAIYTEEILPDFLEILPERFQPCLVQEFLDKKYELRTFYLDGDCYSMCIYSQNDQQTQLDFRRYNDAKPNRNFPYQLPKEVEEGIRVFMKSVNLNTGSIDIVKTKDGRYVFLEVNPVGQFGMTSYPCNYNLEEKIALWLIKKDQEYLAKQATN